MALGSNLGDRSGMLAEALRRLDASEGVEVTGVSAVYETDPVGYTEQPAFLNMAAALRTTLPPLDLLRLLLAVEQQLGRVRDVRWGPRVIDLDLLLYGAVKMDEEELTLPHPRMMERAFVLVPLADVLAAGHPLQAEVAELALAALREGKEGIVSWNTINWRSGSAPFEN
ncbi:2-amino-4-hydroxy-6-hydroxymethyldihydropteridine pyrophosphokinase [Paenibacillus beijingensis]|uniref:2-amino-4-hydroxy-6-hydroxymethyldihydropteridine diphosphokinase n=1 Tax=Paenibacillus beijingensis TaxID=1126833 RepID=A0A0D5NRP5_9BACL|nr:2-amino-4-hydroxy-6-hydroxymethyldihydropteridine diphosphokinase [Paenibacillus beijingensis]AJY77647.1 2-amino-4-hydroxy-6-hydroxymethyldihydropteridine pyrophosphokinase [Paenibacillus beijingensis]